MCVGKIRKQGQKFTEIWECFVCYFQSHRDGEVTHYIDAYNLENGNYLRWINCARNREEENVMVYECKGKIYYATIKDIYPEQELLVYYGSNYAKDLGIDPSVFDY